MAQENSPLTRRANSALYVRGAPPSPPGGEGIILTGGIESVSVG
jgi:hypothetical protein